jgi:hypothetical protein
MQLFSSWTSTTPEASSVMSQVAPMRAMSSFTIEFTGTVSPFHPGGRPPGGAAWRHRNE